VCCEASAAAAAAAAAAVRRQLAASKSSRHPTPSPSLPCVCCARARVSPAACCSPLQTTMQKIAEIEAEVRCGPCGLNTTVWPVVSTACRCFASVPHPCGRARDRRWPCSPARAHTVLPLWQMARTQKNKATSRHIGLLKAKLAKLRSELVAPPKVGSCCRPSRRRDPSPATTGAFRACT
jgi:hypothetical protein